MWISIKDKLPQKGKYVLARHTRGTWSDSEDQDNVNCVVVKLVMGMSMEYREKMRIGEVPMEYERYGNEKVERWRIEKAQDEQSNNLVPYHWESFGTDDFFGQDISHWQPIEKHNPS